MAKLHNLFSTSTTDVQKAAQTDTSPSAQNPRHIAIIMDGNGRWATKRHLPRVAGHKAGVSALRRVVEAAANENIEMLSIYAFSTENWNRPQIEVDSLMRLLIETVRSDLDKLHRDGVRIRHLGRLDNLSPSVQSAVLECIERTKNNTRINLNVCFNYGGRAEIVDAIRHLVADGHDLNELTEDLLSSYLYTRDLPDPDLVIRTAGEMRVSNFLLWQSDYSEYYATSTLWPDFGHEDLLAALESYRQRQRRFGRVNVPTT